jgi:hypothetical protein
MSKPLSLVTMVALSSLILLVATTETAVANEVVNGHGHTTENTKQGEFLGEHSNHGSVENIGGKDGLHQNDQCVFNSQKDFGDQCHSNIKDR